MPVFNFAGGIAHTNSSGDIIWRSDAAPAALLPSGNTITASPTISFPDFSKGNCAVFNIYPVGPSDDSNCISWATILPQEWASTPTLLGTVPSGVNYLDVSVNLSRSNAPDAVLGTVPFIVGIKESNWSDLDGGCVVLEGVGFYRRTIKVYLSGTSVYLQAIQSVTDSAEAAVSSFGIAYKTGAQVWTSEPLNDFEGLATHGGDARGWIAYELDRKSSGGNLNKIRGGPNAPSFSDPSDFSATYTGTITVRPGYVQT